jgi:hypothetical protein
MHDHEIVPKPGTARRERDGQPADIRNPLDYPATARCMTCGRRVRCGSWLNDWYHTTE